jgi:hypothetical protein
MRRSPATENLHRLHTIQGQSPDEDNQQSNVTYVHSAAQRRARRAQIISGKRAQLNAHPSSISDRTRSKGRERQQRYRAAQIESQGIDRVRAEETIQRQRRRKKQDDGRHSWWTSFDRKAPNLSVDHWLPPCPICGVCLLSSEAKTFCCNHGKRVLPRLKPLPPNISNIVDVNRSAVATLSRKLNNLFCLTTMGVSGKFVDFAAGIQTVCIEGAYLDQYDIETVH